MTTLTEYELGISPDYEQSFEEPDWVPLDYDEPPARKPTAKQLSYLRKLADRTGQTFTYPKTLAQASREIRRLKNTRPSSRVERAIERDERAAQHAALCASCGVPIAEHELTGYGSSATWSQRG